jgi:hypothetical protein
MLKNARTASTTYLSNAGCSCCNTKQERRTAKHTAKRREARAWKKDVR